MIKKASLLFNTVKHLKPIQVFYQLKYRLIKAGTLNDYDKFYLADNVSLLLFAKQPPVYLSYLGGNRFVFLNQEVQFDSEIDWDYQENGKLWNYNLQYANWLLQDDVSFEEKLRLLGSLYEWLNNGQLALEPYPVSLRVINVMRLFSHESKQDGTILANTYAELDFLSKRPEYHLLGNHLLENAFALMMGGAFFSNVAWLVQGQSILKKELEEQILFDGAHFELSPMYHQIIFFRLLELIDWFSNWSEKNNSFE
ncbi:heparinase, partial [bacterium]|nr:heparinase [bacterium]